MDSQGGLSKLSPILSRRNFLILMGLGVATAGVSILEPQQVWEDLVAAFSPMINWKPGTFDALTTPTFIVNGGPVDHLALDLIQLQDGAMKVYNSLNLLEAAAAEDCFILVFRGPGATVLSQGTYEFKHPQFGRFSLFITPGLASEQGQNYTAVINHVQV